MEGIIPLIFCMLTEENLFNLNQSSSQSGLRFESGTSLMRSKSADLCLTMMFHHTAFEINFLLGH
jgi:hypothetical protein